MKKKLLLFLSVLFVFLCAGCAASEGAGANSGTSAEGAGGKEGGLSMLSSPAATPQGYYELIEGSGSSRLIVYYDYATRQRVYLSSDASAALDETSTAYIPSKNGAVSCYTDGEYLYAVGGGGVAALPEPLRGDAEPPYLLRMGLNGANRQRLTFPLNQNIQWAYGAARDAEGCLYFTVFSLDAAKPVEEMSQTTLVRANFDTQKTEPLFTVNSQTQLRITGVYDGKLLLQKTVYDEDPSAVMAQSEGLRPRHELTLFDIDAGEETPVLSFEKEDYKNQKIIYHDEKLYYMRPQSNAVYAYGLASETETVLCPDLPGDFFGPGADASLEGRIMDGKLFFTISLPQAEGGSSDEPRAAALDLATGERFFPNLTLTADAAKGPFIILPAAESSDYFFVHADSHEYTSLQSAPNGETYSVKLYAPVYKLILKDDYWHSRPNYIDFEDHALPPQP
ncbi:MAG: hypothetical protein Q4G07_03105 [Oscillospiraceae bacterium]|nr:hypothetical protein [Oscillospiraceae bacterium]